MLLLGLALPALAAEAKGKIKSLDGDKYEFVLTDGNQKTWRFHAEKEAKIYINDKEAKFSEMRPGDDATVTYEKRGEKMMADEVRITRK